MLEFYLVGRGVSYSLSPVMYEWFFSEAGLTASYSILEVPSRKSLPGAVEWLRGRARGFNVTIPYKRAITPLLDETSDAASRIIGAVNTVVVRGGRLSGYNTDWLGFKVTLEEEMRGEGLEVSEAVLVGYGGAARAALYALARLGFRHVHIVGRSTLRARDLALEAREWGEWSLTWGPLHGGSPGGTGSGYLLVNATPMGSCGVEWLVSPCGLVGEASIVYDMVYYPVETPLIRCARARGIPSVNGLEMLAGQASFNLRVWLGVGVEWGRLYSIASMRAVRGCRGRGPRVNRGVNRG